MEKFDVLIGIVVPKGKENCIEEFKNATKEILDKPFMIEEQNISVAKQRKIMIEEAKKRNCKGILFLECDVIPPKNLFELVMTKADIVGGAYLQWVNMGVPKVAPCAFALADEGIAFLPIDVVMPKTILPVAAVGFGCAYVNSKVFNKIEYPENDNDDLEFCQKAREKGFSIAVNAGVKCISNTGSGKLEFPMSRAGLSFSET
ncbi:hypothetical protein HY486_01455 [Candidatus Woesearchaeota archaeon]|nr:hypothetical protein [Candidatus Woesearchaeota archaeon]